jgi:hypothetical protein
MSSLGQTELGTDPRSDPPYRFNVPYAPSLLRVKNAGSALCLTCRDE